MNTIKKNYKRFFFKIAITNGIPKKIRTPDAQTGPWALNSWAGLETQDPLALRQTPDPRVES